ncbi:hypothetical protein FLONG3_4307 [Fusarium longipes]|uniref:Uncharacterized protein n=1 Tax=Fusarium longipes TaxID=694270 RepID=A0A395SZM6_9HYPO|nr:hypothetical protein FLONG3_4307 [Fusarium longipes]
MPKTRGGKPNQRASSKSFEIGQLQTTPTSRHLQSPQVDHPGPSSAQPQDSANDLEDGIDDNDFSELDEAGRHVPNHVAPDFWSEAVSTRRSTPVEEDGTNPFECPESPIDDFSSQKSGSGKLPSTQPLPSQLIAELSADKKVPLVDFSETATTARRSSPYLPQTLSQAAADFSWEHSENNTVPELPGTIPDSFEIPMGHLPEDELYDATPEPENREEHAAEEEQHVGKSNPPQVTSKGKTSKSLVKVLEDEVGPISQELPSLPHERTTARRPGLEKNAGQVKESPGSTIGNPKSAEKKTSATRRGKQRPKSPLKFNEQTNQIIEPESTNMPMVNRMHQAYAASPQGAKKPTPKSRNKASPKTASKGARKTSPKTAPKNPSKAAKATPKAAKKVSAPVQRTTRQSARRDQVDQQSPEQADQKNSNVSPAASLVELKVEPLPAGNQRTTRSKVKREQTSVQQSRGQERFKTKNNTQGSTEDPIILSSGRGSSSLHDDDEFVPATDPTELSPAEAARLDTVPQVERQSLVDPEPLNINQNTQGRIESEISNPIQPVRRIERQFTATKKTIAVKADPKALVEVPLERTKRQPIRIGPREVLSARDANALARRTASEANSLKRPPSARDPVVDTSAPPRKVSKLSRSFSVSQAGSPLPVETAAAQLVEGHGPGNRDNVEHPTVSPNKQMSSHRRSQRLRGTAD